MDDRQQPVPYSWTSTETTENLDQFKNQYIRVNITGLGWVVAQLLGTEAGGVVTLNVYFPGTTSPQFMRINRNELTGLVPLGFMPPAEVTTPPPPPSTGSTGHVPTPPKPFWCMLDPFNPACRKSTYLIPTQDGTRYLTTYWVPVNVYH